VKRWTRSASFRRHALAGAQPPKVLVQMLDMAAREASEAAERA
jgi:hypothetical protein